MIHRYTTFIKAINLTIDYVILNMSMIIAYFIVDNSFLFWADNHYLPFVLVFNLIWLLAANITGLSAGKYELRSSSADTATGWNVTQIYINFDPRKGKKKQIDIQMTLGT